MDYPAAHSTDTEWFSVDGQGQVAVLDTGSFGYVPNVYREEIGDRRQGWDFFEDLPRDDAGFLWGQRAGEGEYLAPRTAAQLFALLEHELDSKWYRERDLYQLNLLLCQRADPALFLDEAALSLVHDAPEHAGHFYRLPILELLQQLVDGRILAGVSDRWASPSNYGGPAQQLRFAQHLGLFVFYGNGDEYRCQFVPPQPLLFEDLPQKSREVLQWAPLDELRFREELRFDVRQYYRSYGGSY